MDNSAEFVSIKEVKLYLSFEDLVWLHDIIRLKAYCDGKVHLVEQLMVELKKGDR